MNNQKSWVRILLRVLSYVLVAVLTASVTYVITVWNNWQGMSKLQQLEKLIDTRFIGNADKTAMEDAAADAMVAATGDRWSYYIPASSYGSYVEQMENAYVGIGVTIQQNETGDGLKIVQMEPGGAAKAGGVLIGDEIIAVEGKTVAQEGLDGASNLIRGEAGTKVRITVRRIVEESPQELEFTLERKVIQTAVAEGKLLNNNIGLVTINNFNERCAQESIDAIDALIDQGAKALVFDVRFNPGGYKDELVKLLDYLLPKGDLFHSQDYTGFKETDTSDADCLKMPMAVLVNGNSYSAAEFFAAALDEYDWAVVVGEPTVGKSHFQNTFQLSDGSAVALSIGKYFTPNGVSLADQGGLKPEILVEVDDETEALIYADSLEAEKDPQLQAAIQALMDEMN